MDEYNQNVPRWDILHLQCHLGVQGTKDQYISKTGHKNWNPLVILKGRRKYYIHLYILCYIIYNSILIWKVITDEAKRLNEIVFSESIFIFNTFYGLSLWTITQTCFLFLIVGISSLPSSCTCPKLIHDSTYSGKQLEIQGDLWYKTFIGNIPISIPYHLFTLQSSNTMDYSTKKQCEYSYLFIFPTTTQL